MKEIMAKKTFEVATATEEVVLRRLEGVVLKSAVLSVVRRHGFGELVEVVGYPVAFVGGYTTAPIDRLTGATRRGAFGQTIGAERIYVYEGEIPQPTDIGLAELAGRLQSETTQRNGAGIDGLSDVSIHIETADGKFSVRFSLCHFGWQDDPKKFLPEIW